MPNADRRSATFIGAPPGTLPPGSRSQSASPMHNTAARFATGPVYARGLLTKIGPVRGTPRTGPGFSRSVAGTVFAAGR